MFFFRRVGLDRPEAFLRDGVKAALEAGVDVDPVASDGKGVLKSLLVVRCFCVVVRDFEVIRHHELLVGVLLAALQLVLENGPFISEFLSLHAALHLRIPEFLLEVFLLLLVLDVSLVLVGDDVAELLAVLPTLVLLELASVHLLITVGTFQCDV